MWCSVQNMLWRSKVLWWEASTGKHKAWQYMGSKSFHILQRTLWRIGNMLLWRWLAPKASCRKRVRGFQPRPELFQRWWNFILELSRFGSSRSLDNHTHFLQWFPKSRCQWSWSLSFRICCSLRKRQLFWWCSFVFDFRLELLNLNSTRHLFYRRCLNISWCYKE